MAKENLMGSFLIGGGLAAIGAFFLLTAKKEGGGESPDILKSITDFIDSLFKLPTTIIDGIPKPDGDGKDGGGSGGGGSGGGGGGDGEQPSGSVTFGAAGDWGSGRNQNWKKVVTAMKNAKVQVMLGLGDYSYTSVSDWQPVVNELKKAGIVSKGAEGNHDSSSYAKTFGQSSFLTSYEKGPAVVIILNTESGSGGNVAFAEKILKSTKKQWKILIMHKPPYSNSSKHGAERSLANALKPIINKYGVQLVLAAHNHNYQRMIISGMSNTTFIVAGTGGESHYGLKSSQGGTKYMNDNDFGFVKIAINGNTLKGSFITSGGKTLDSFTISYKAAKLAQVMRDYTYAPRISLS